MSQESEIRVEEATLASEDKGTWKEGDVANDLGNREKGNQKRKQGSGRGPVVNIVEAWSKREEKS